MKPHYPWTLVGPWYRWPQPSVKASGRESQPILQKYASPDFVNEFLKEPQRSLKFTDEDFVHAVVDSGGSKFSLSNKTYQKVLPERRKVYLDTHSRFYLVVCELHCDTVGFPSVARDKVCEAGFVVRRKRVRVPAEARPDVISALRGMVQSQTKMRTLESIAIAKEASAGQAEGTPGTIVSKALDASRAKRQTKLQDQYFESQAELETLVTRFNIEVVLEGWVPSEEFDGVGSWQEVQEAPEEVVEHVFPLYPLIPDPAMSDHSAQGRALWFGILPTASTDISPDGTARFDDRGLYEVRCFVRRHKPECPKTSAPGDCPGELVWSLPTESYQLAAHFDLDGTSNRPVTVQLPDLSALEAQANSLPFGQGTGVRMVSPPDSGMNFAFDSDGNPTNGQLGGASICFFSIPLITIVATFVLKLFLPVVVFLFGLWFLLRLRFCIPPSLSIDADLALTLEADISLGLDLDASLEVEIHAAIDANFHPEVSEGLKADHDLNQLGKLVLDLSTDYTADAPADLAAHFDPPPPGSGGLQGTLPSVTSKLEYYERLEVPRG